MLLQSAADIYENILFGLPSIGLQLAYLFGHEQEAGPSRPSSRQQFVCDLLRTYKAISF
jgi:hypothetical protein